MNIEPTLRPPLIPIDGRLPMTPRPVGCGDALALGAMWALGAVGVAGAEDRVRTALQAAQRFNAGVREPFVVVSTAAD